MGRRSAEVAGASERSRGIAAAAALCAVAVAGCGLGPGPDAGSIELTVSRDYGTRILRSDEVPVKSDDSVIRVLDREAELGTRFGGGFVDAIDGIAGGESGGRRNDWFFYVNGVESSLGAAEYELGDGDRVWWDYHDWSTAMRVPAVVGDWPEPFVSDHADLDWSAGVYCGGAETACERVAAALREEGVETDAPEGADGEIRVLVGPWDAIRADPVGGLLRFGPDRSGVFATFAGTGEDTGLTLLSSRGRVVETFGEGAGLIAALRPDEDAPTWVVTGTDPVGVAAATEALGEPLADRYAVAVAPGGDPIGVPVP